MLAQLAHAYRSGAAATPSAAELVTLGDWITDQFRLIPAQILVTPSEFTLRQCIDCYVQSGRLVISTANNSHPFLTAPQNTMFRAVHDWHHIIAGADDTLQGEIVTYKVAKTTAPQSIWWLLLSEIVLQAAACIYFGQFQDQKLVRL